MRLRVSGASSEPPEIQNNKQVVVRPPISRTSQLREEATAPFRYARANGMD